MLLAGLMSLSLQTIYAQRITRSFRNTSMSEALTILAKSTKDYRINFMYDELEDFTVTTSIVKRTAPDAIRQIMGFYPMKMTIDGENIFVECTQKTSTQRDVHSSLCHIKRKRRMALRVPTHIKIKRPTAW